MYTTWRWSRYKVHGSNFNMKPRSNPLRQLQHKTNEKSTEANSTESQWRVHESKFEGDQLRVYKGQLSKIEFMKLPWMLILRWGFNLNLGLFDNICSYQGTFNLLWICLTVYSHIKELSFSFSLFDSLYSNQGILDLRFVNSLYLYQ